MFIFAKSIKGKEFMYSKKHSVLCKSKKQAEQLADFMNSHNDKAKNDWKLKDNEIWWVYEIGNFELETIPYKIKKVKDNIVIAKNN